MFHMFQKVPAFCSIYIGVKERVGKTEPWTRMHPVIVFPSNGNQKVLNPTGSFWQISQLRQLPYGHMVVSLVRWCEVNLCHSSLQNTWIWCVCEGHMRQIGSFPLSLHIKSQCGRGRFSPQRRSGLLYPFYISSSRFVPIKCLHSKRYDFVGICRRWHTLILKDHMH